MWRSLIIGAVLIGASGVVFSTIRILYSRAPAGPAQARGWEGRYYNLAYALTPCSSAPLELYEDENISFFYFSNKEARGMERHVDSGEAKQTFAETNLKYSSAMSNVGGNTDLVIYKPKNRKPAEMSELKEFVEKHALETVGINPEIKYGIVPGAPFSAGFVSGAREGICFTDLRHNLYCLKDQDMPMQRGDILFIPWLRRSLGLSPFDYSEHDYGRGEFKEWFEWPSREKKGDCNFIEIKRTIRVKQKKS